MKEDRGVTNGLATMLVMKKFQRGHFFSLLMHFLLLLLFFCLCELLLWRLHIYEHLSLTRVQYLHIETINFFILKSRQMCYYVFCAPPPSSRSRFQPAFYRFLWFNKLETLWLKRFYSESSHPFGLILTLKF